MIRFSGKTIFFFCSKFSLSFSQSVSQLSKGKGQPNMYILVAVCLSLPLFPRLIFTYEYDVNLDYWLRVYVVALDVRSTISCFFFFLTFDPIWPIDVCVWHEIRYYRYYRYIWYRIWIQRKLKWWFFFRTRNNQINRFFKNSFFLFDNFSNRKVNKTVEGLRNTTIKIDQCQIENRNICLILCFNIVSNTNKYFNKDINILLALSLSLSFRFM